MSEPSSCFLASVGIFQQGKELQLSSQALQLQADELRHSVDQQREMVTVSRQQLDHEKKVALLQEVSRKQRIQPKFLCKFSAEMGTGDSHFKYILRVVNAGHPASKLSATVIDSGTTVCKVTCPFVQMGWESSAIHAFGGEFVARIQRKLLLEVRYYDDDGDFCEIVSELSEPFGQNGFGEFLSVELSKKTSREF